MTEKPDSNSDFAGFIPDLLEMVANHANFSYNLKLVDDRKYGQRDSNNHWTGMIGEILTGVSRRVIPSIRWSFVFHLCG